MKIIVSLALVILAIIIYLLISNVPRGSDVEDAIYLRNQIRDILLESDVMVGSDRLNDLNVIMFKPKRNSAIIYIISPSPSRDSIINLINKKLDSIKVNSFELRFMDKQMVEVGEMKKFEKK
jgi:hypothetical protein